MLAFSISRQENLHKVEASRKNLNEVIFQIWKENHPSNRMFLNRYLPTAFMFLKDVVFTFVWNKFLKTLKCSSGHVKYSLENPAENFLRKYIIFVAQSPKTITKLYFWQKMFFLKSYSLQKQYFKEKRFHSFKRHLEQNWWAENMPELPDRLVFYLSYSSSRVFHSQNCCLFYLCY